MKTLFVALMIVLMNSVPTYAGTLDGKLGEKKQRASYTEIKQLFRGKSQKLTATGAVTAIVKVDNNGRGQVIEINSEDQALLDYVTERVESRTFKNLNNETIRLVVDFRN